MPADPSIPSGPSAHHGNGDAPYPCSVKGPGRAAFAIDYGFCRTSLDHHPASDKVGSSDPRCPAKCPHKAPEAVAIRFTKLFNWHGAASAARMARKEKGKKS